MKIKIIETTKQTKKQLFLKSYKSTLGHISNACTKINIGRQMYYDWLKADPAFKKDIENIDESFIDLAESALRKNIESGMQKAVEFYLCNKKKSSYTNTVRNQLSGLDGPISVTLREIVYKGNSKTPETPAK